MRKRVRLLGGEFMVKSAPGRGTRLHDIGKMGVPDYILHKPGPLDDEEWKVMRQHPAFAYEMLTPITYLHPALDIPIVITSAGTASAIRAA